MKATIWIQESNEEFWYNLENKSGWVNMLIESFREMNQKDDEMYAKADDEPYDPLASIHDPFEHLPPEDRPIY